MILLCKKLGLDVDLKDVRVVENCDVDFEVDDDFVLFTCPALYHKVKDRVEDYEVLDLRVLKAFKKSSEVAKAVLASEVIRSDLEVEAIETGKDVVYVGDNVDLISELALHCNLTVVTQNDKTIKKLYPYEVRVVKGYVKDIKGTIGDFEVEVEGVDLVNGREVKTLKAGQIIYPNYKGDVEGVYTDEYRGAFKVLANLGGYLKIKTVEVNPDVCGVMKSGLIGCTHCLSCPTNTISVDKKFERITVNLAKCEGCGFCASICFTSAIQNKLLPSDTLLRKIDAVANVTECDILAFVCKRALGELSNFKDLPTIAPILVPCINAVSEVHYLYAVLKGFRVVAIPCNCKNLKLDCFEIAKQTLNAFGFDCIALANWSELKDVVKKLKKSKIPKVEFELKGENKRLQWLSLVESLMVYEVKNPRFETAYFGKIKINENCTLCNACKNFCPMNAIRKEEGKILFTHALCIACELCVKACPENAIELEKVLDFENLQEVVAFEDEMIKCPKCGKPHISKRAYEKMKRLTGMEKALLFCKDCRPIILLEGIYEEIVKDIEELRRRRLGDV